ncbi:MAG TPA: biotin/lipoyl-containing protein [Myxococcales bacterium]|nr:biotin/lipoyl-containing protein [Myxococcales bacterium]
MRRYRATLGKRSVDLEVDRQGDALRVTLDGAVHEIDALELPDGAISLIVDGRSFSAEYEEKGDDVAVLLRHSVFSVEVLDERRLRMRAASGKLTAEGPQVIVAPMPGKVVRVLVKAGDAVAEGQGLLVVEAMKMENELRAAKAGKVVEVAVREGTAVEGGAKLCLVE